MKDANHKSTNSNKEAKTLSATDLANAWYLGCKVSSPIINTKGLCRSLRSKGLTKSQRKEVIRNAI